MTSSTKNDEIKKRVYNDNISYEEELIRDDNPIVVRKNELARKQLEKAPLPEELLNRYKRD